MPKARDNRRAVGVGSAVAAIAVGGTVLQANGVDAFSAVSRIVSATSNGFGSQKDERRKSTAVQAFTGQAVAEADFKAPRSWVSACVGVVGAVAVAAARLRPRLGPKRRGKQQVVAVQAEADAAAVEAPVEVPPVWVINLDKSKARWEQCKEEFATQGVKAERFPATYGAHMSREEMKEKTTWSARYFCTPGMVGCFMSHLNIWKKVVEDDLPAVVVLEDDVVIYPDFNERLKVLLKELPKDWDVCLLGAVGCINEEDEPIHMKSFGMITGGGRKKEGKSRTISPNVFIPYKPAGTHSYMVSRKGAEVLSRLLPKPRYHVDITAWALKELRLYMAKPILATQRFDEADTTVSKGGAPVTYRFIRWCWDVTGLSAMAKKGGLPNLTWAWKIAVFALPVPFSSKRIIVEMGPSSSVFVLLCLLSIPMRSMVPAGVGLLYMNSIICMVRWLAGTQNIVPVAAITAMALACFYVG